MIHPGSSGRKQSLPGDMAVYRRQCSTPGCTEVFESTVPPEKIAYHSIGCRRKTVEQRAKARKGRTWNTEKKV